MSKRLLEYSQLVERGITYSRRHLDRLEAAGKFPVRVKLGIGKIAWVESEIDDYIRALTKRRAA